MSAPVRKAGASGAQVTGSRYEVADKRAVTVTLEGTFAELGALTDAAAAAFLPAGYSMERRTLTPDGAGMGRLEVYGVTYDGDGTSQDGAPVRTTFRIDMEEVTYDLIDHPAVCADPADRAACERWLAADPASRSDGEGGWQYPGDDGEPVAIESEAAQRFCAAWMAGIRQFVRYYPVVEKVSVWRNPPGMNRSGRSFTGGSPRFSDAVGTFDTPPLSLGGYPSTNWFKSRDSWTERGDRTWQREERWTYTPDGSGGAHAWIYGGGGD